MSDLRELHKVSEDLTGQLSSYQHALSWDDMLERTAHYRQAVKTDWPLVALLLAGKLETERRLTTASTHQAMLNIQSIVNQWQHDQDLGAHPDTRPPEDDQPSLLDHLDT